MVAYMGNGNGNMPLLPERPTSLRSRSSTPKQGLNDFLDCGKGFRASLLLSLFQSEIRNMSLSLSSTHEWISRRLTGEGVLSGISALHDPFSLFLVQCIIILTICRLLGLLGAGLNQPKVIFEIIGKWMMT
jgi:hypothetical protein